MAVGLNELYANAQLLHTQEGIALMTSFTIVIFTHAVSKFCFNANADRLAFESSADFRSAWLFMSQIIFPHVTCSPDSFTDILPSESYTTVDPSTHLLKINAGRLYVIEEILEAVDTTVAISIPSDITVERLSVCLKVSVSISR